MMQSIKSFNANNKKIKMEKQIKPTVDTASKSRRTNCSYWFYCTRCRKSNKIFELTILMAWMQQRMIKRFIRASICRVCCSSCKKAVQELSKMNDARTQRSIPCKNQLNELKTLVLISKSKHAAHAVQVPAPPQSAIVFK